MAHRAEVKVYMSHTDLARVQEGAKRRGLTLSSYLRCTALLDADEMGVPQYELVLVGQPELAFVVKEGVS